jgi:hypothetical protein
MPIFRFPNVVSRPCGTTLAHKISRRSSPFYAPPLKAFLPDSIGSMPKWQRWVATMETYLRAHPRHAALIVDELQTLLDRLTQTEK